MVIDFARPNIAELVDGESLPGISSGSIKPLDDLARTLTEGTKEEKGPAYHALRFFVGIYDGRFNVPGMQLYREALQAYEQSLEPSY